MPYGSFIRVQMCPLLLLHCRVACTYRYVDIGPLWRYAVFMSVHPKQKPRCIVRICCKSHCVQLNIWGITKYVTFPQISVALKIEWGFEFPYTLFVRFVLKTMWELILFAFSESASPGISSYASFHASNNSEFIAFWTSQSAHGSNWVSYIFPLPIRYSGCSRICSSWLDSITPWVPCWLSPYTPISRCDKKDSQPLWIDGKISVYSDFSSIPIYLSSFCLCSESYEGELFRSVDNCDGPERGFSNFMGGLSILRWCWFKSWVYEGLQNWGMQLICQCTFRYNHVFICDSHRWSSKWSFARNKMLIWHFIHFLESIHLSRFTSLRCKRYGFSDDLSCNLNILLATLAADHWMWAFKSDSGMIFDCSPKIYGE